MPYNGARHSGLGLVSTSNAHTAPATLALGSQASITDSPLGFAMKTKLVLYFMSVLILKS